MNIQDIVEDSGLSRDTRSSALNRALKQAYAAYPSAKSDIEAFAAWAMDRQSNADELISRQADLNRRQDAVIGSIDKVNTDQEQHINALDQENNELAAELEKVEKKLAIKPAAHQPKRDKKADKPANDKSTEKDTGYVPAAAQVADEPETDNKVIKSMLPQLNKADNPQQPLPFDKPAAQEPAPTLQYQPSDNVYIPTTQKSGFRPFRAPAPVTDVETKRVHDLAKDLASNPEKLRTAMGLKESIQRLQHLAGNKR